MFNLIDLLIIVILFIAGFFGMRRGAIKQLGGFLGIISGIFLAAYLYNLLAFLTENSTIKLLLLAAILAAATFLLYDIFSTLATRLQKQPFLKKFIDTLPDRIGSALFSALSSFVVVWLAVPLVGSVLPLSLQIMVKEAGLITAASDFAKPPTYVSNVGQLLKPFSAPEIFVGSEPSIDFGASSVSVEYDQLDTAIAAATNSVVKVTTWGCGSIGTGSGFIISPQTIMTNAHVVAGADRMSIQAQNGNVFMARAVLFDPQLDIAILASESTLPAAPLEAETKSLGVGSIGAVLGFPGGGNFTTDDIIILQQIEAEGFDIYEKQKITRQLYAMRGNIVPGNSGGPLIASSGKVAGIVLGHSTSNSRTGYALAANQISSAIKTAPGLSTTVGVGPCAGS